MSQDIAKIGLEVDSTQVENAKNKLDQLTPAAQRTEGAIESFKKNWLSMTASIASGMAVYEAALAIIMKVYNALENQVLAAARYNSMGVVMERVGKQAGYSAEQMQRFQKQLEDGGIAMTEARETLSRMAMAHIDLSKSAQLSRLAQDAAVIANTNSSEAFARVVYGIQTAQPEILRTLGLTVNFHQAYTRLAIVLNKNVKDLTENEKMQARLNSVLEKGKDIAGVYSDAMDTAGKQLTSLKRFQDNLAVSMGQLWQDTLLIGVRGYTDYLKDALATTKSLSDDGSLKEWGRDLAMIFAVLMDVVNDFVQGIKASSAVMVGFALLAQGAVNYLGGATQRGKMQMDDGMSFIKSELATINSSFGKYTANAEKLFKEVEERAKKRKEDQLAHDKDYVEKSLAVQRAYANYSVEIQRKAQEALRDSFYPGSMPQADAPRKPDNSIGNRQNEAVESLRRQILAGKDLSEVEKTLFEIRFGNYQKFSEQKKNELLMLAETIDMMERQDSILKRQKELHTEKQKDQEKDLEIQDGIINFMDDYIEKMAHEVEMMKATKVEKAGLEAAFELEKKWKDEISKLSENYSQDELNRLRKEFEAKKAIILLEVNKKAQIEQSANIAKKAENEQQARLRLTIDMYKDMQKIAMGLVHVLSTGFGNVGKTMADLVKVFGDFAVTSEKIMKDYQESLKEAEKSSDPLGAIGRAIREQQEETAQASMKMYGDIAGAAKGFFKEHSAGYRILEATEKAFHVATMAMEMEKFITKIGNMLGITAVKTTTTATNMTLDTTETTQSVGNSMIDALASTVAGVAKAFKQMGVYGFIGAAAIIAFMASLGVSAGGGGSGPSLSQERQQSQGTGTVLGDDNAKSNSLANSLEILRQNSSSELIYQSGMLSALRSIESNMKGLAAVIARNPRLTGANTDGLGLGGGTRLGWGTTRTLADAGIVINAQTVQTARSNISASGYADVETQRSSWFGLSRSTSISRQTQELPAQMLDYLSKTVDSMAKAIAAAAKVLLGSRVTAEQINSILNAINIDLTNISLKDMAGADIQSALESVLSSIGDAMVEGLFSIAGLKALEDFQHVGEGAFETMIRVASGVERATSVLNQWGIQIIDWRDIVNKQGDVTTELIRDSIVLAETLPIPLTRLAGATGPVISGVGRIIQGFEGTADEIISLYNKLKELEVGLRSVGIPAGLLNQEMITAAGGITALQAGINVYASRFFTAQEQIAFGTSEVSSRFTALGLTMPGTQAAFRTMIENARAMGDSERLGALLAIVPAWQDVQDAARDAAEEAHQSWMNVSDLLGQLNGESEAERNARHAGDYASQFARDNPWAAGMNFDQMITSFREMFKDPTVWAALSKEQQNLILAMLGLAVEMKDNTDVLRNMDPAYTVSAGDHTSRLMSDFQRRFGGIIGEQDGASAQITLERSLAQEQIAANTRRQREIQTQYGDRGYLNPPEYQGLATANLLLEERMRNLGLQLGIVTVLTAQYGKETANAIFELDNWYKEQKETIGNNHVALLALDQLYAERRREILEESVREITEARNEMKRWRADLLGQESPLTAQQRLTASASRYNTAWIAAQAVGAGQEQFNEYRTAAEAYMREGSSFYGRASAAFGEIFARILRESGFLSGELDRSGNPIQQQQLAAMYQMEQTYITEGDETRQTLTTEVASLRVEIQVLRDALIEALETIPAKMQEAAEAGR